jgi:kynurenine formamidase
MPALTEPATGLQFYELSHEFGHGAPAWPTDQDVQITRGVNHATHGVMAQRLIMHMHFGTHLNAPIHLIQSGDFVGDLPLDMFFGNGVVLSIPKDKWELVTAADLAAATPKVEAGDIVIINTGWHKRYSDSQEYFGLAPGLAPDAADWLIARKVKLVGVDTAAVDHPMATSLAAHRNGPQMKRLPARYKKETGRDPKADFPDWNPAHRALLGAGIATIENVGGNVDEVSGKRVTFHAYPWRWKEGDASLIRLMAILDLGGAYRIEPGK